MPATGAAGRRSRTWSAGRSRSCSTRCNPCCPTSRPDGSALALSNPARIPALPETPTMAEAGIPGHETTAWWAVVAPARTSEPVLTALADAIRRLAVADDWRSHLSRLGIDPVLRTGPELAAFVRAET